MKKLVNSKSLASTLDTLNEAFFERRILPRNQRERAAKWIAGRQGLPGAYAWMFAPTSHDFENGIRVFTGEKIHTRAAIAHILGEEACRALILLDVSLPVVHEALDRASAGICALLPESNIARQGLYCCVMCTCSLWRHIAAGGFEKENPERILAAGMRRLKLHRDGNGRWKRFPFYYTLLALSDIYLPAAVTELRYALPACERYLRRSLKNDMFLQRRKLLIERVLERYG